MRSRNLVILSAVVAVLAVAIFGTVGFGIYAGLTAAHKPSPHGVVSGSAPEGVAGASGTTNTAAAPGGAALPVADSAANSSAIAQPAPGAFYPGMPPFGTGGAAADGISAWGVAYRQVSDPAAQPDAALIKAAYQDAEKKAADLAAATGTEPDLLDRLLRATIVVGVLERSPGESVATTEVSSYLRTGPGSLRDLVLMLSSPASSARWST